MVPRSQNVRYQCANVGFLALKLPSHSGIIHAHCLSPSNYLRHQFRYLPTGSLSLASPYALPPHLHIRRLPLCPSSLSPSPSPSLSISFFDLSRTRATLLVALATSLITTTTTATTSYRPGHLLENNIHKVEPRRYDRLFLLPPSLSLFSLFFPRSVPLLASSFSPSLRRQQYGISNDVAHLHLRSWFRGRRETVHKEVHRRRTQNGHVERVVRYFASCRFDNRARLPPSTSSRITSRNTPRSRLS